MDTKRTLETLKGMYTRSEYEYDVPDTFENGYQAALLEVMTLIEGGFPSVLDGVAYVDMGEVEAEFTKNYEFAIYVQKLKSLKDLLSDEELNVLIEHWWDDYQISAEVEDALFSYVKNVLRKERMDNAQVD